MHQRNPLHIGFSKIHVAPIQTDFGKVVPHPKQNPKKQEKINKNKQTPSFIRATLLLPKQTSKAYVILEGYDKIVNAKDPNIQLFSIPIVLSCKMLNAKKLIQWVVNNHYNFWNHFTLTYKLWLHHNTMNGILMNNHWIDPIVYGYP
jgi:hypothetical protein